MEEEEGDEEKEGERESFLMKRCKNCFLLN